VTFFFPNVIASVAVALLWVLLYSTTEMGPINNIREALHMEKVPFLESARLLQSIVPMMVWSATGFYLVLF
jgi:ABC-type sugar transport system permease subunit